MGDKTTLTVQDDTLERFNGEKPEGVSADAFVNQLLDGDTSIPPGILSIMDGDVDTEEIRSRMENSEPPEWLDEVDGGLTYDDVKAACEAALRESVADEVLK